jgi:hypothetical protein
MVAFKSKTACAVAAQTLRDAKVEALANSDEAFGFERTYIRKLTTPSAYASTPASSSANSEIVAAAQTTGIIEAVR